MNDCKNIYDQFGKENEEEKRNIHTQIDGFEI